MPKLQFPFGPCHDIAANGGAGAVKAAFRTVGEAASRTTRVIAGYHRPARGH